MLNFPNAKINLGLRVCARRPDGYHDLETVFVPIPIYDVLEIVDAKETSFHFSGLSIPGKLEDNLLFKVFQRFQSEFKLPAQKILLHKYIPMGAGLGGGSSDATFLIKLLNEKFELALSVGELQAYATEFGADCAFFIENKSVLAKGIGDQFEPVVLPVAEFYLALIKPPLQVSTAMAYGKVRPALPNESLQMVLNRPIEQWRDHLVNDFEPGIFSLFPELAAIKQELYALGAIYAAMSGSGSTMFALFKEEPNLQSFEDYNFVFCEKIKL